MRTWPRWKVGCVLVSALCLMLIMGCFLAGAVIQRRTVAPPTLHLAVGSVQLVAYGTNRPDCPPYGGRKPTIAAICGGESIFSSAQAYTVWIMVPGRPSPSGLPRTLFRRLLLLPIDY
jgi:hypothetical protein